MAANHPLQSHYHLDSRDGSEPIKLGNKQYPTLSFTTVWKYVHQPVQFVSHNLITVACLGALF